MPRKSNELNNYLATQGSDMKLWGSDLAAKIFFLLQFIYMW